MEAGFPVLFEGEGEVDRAALRRQLRLRSIRKGEGVLGRAYEAGQMRSSDEQEMHVAAVPMKHGDRCVGILALVRDASGDPFSEEEHRVLDAIAEQSAFALFTADIFFEAAEKRTMEKDLQVAHEVQRILLPGTLPDFGGYEIAGVNVPARHVSGDYYDFIEVSPRHRGLAIADVSGKGVPASLLMAMCRSVLRCVSDGEESAAKALRRLNRHLYPDIREDMFISMAYAILDGETSTVRLARAGHDAPLWYHAVDGSITRISPPGLAIGIDDGPVFDRVTGDLEVVLEAGDMIVFFTDGVTEALDAQGDEFGMERLMACVREAASGGALSVVEGITARVGEFAKDQPRHDDVTLVVLRRK
jgi:sigma-B regulation protein RsbU (phosphoserine phosphatase)